MEGKQSLQGLHQDDHHALVRALPAGAGGQVFCFQTKYLQPLGSPFPGNLTSESGPRPRGLLTLTCQGKLQILYHHL
jgi:hypothetical protein